MEQASNTLGGGGQLTTTSPASTTTTNVCEPCKECGTTEECFTYPILVPETGWGGRMCCACYHGEKDKECEDCGTTFNPKEDGTFRVCGHCYDAAHTDDTDEEDE